MRATLLLMLVVSSGTESTAVLQEKATVTRSIAFQRGRATVERDGNVDHVSITDARANLISESWCSLETGSYDELSAFFKRFVAALDDAKPEVVASLVRYPLQVNGKPRIEVSDRRTLLRRYSEVFTAAVLKKIRGAAPEAIFCRNGQAMIGDGVIWVHSEKGQVAVDVVNR